MGGVSNFPLGFLNGVTIRGVPLQQTQPGEVFWVNSTTVLPVKGVGGSDGNKGTYQKPFATIDKAISSCTASRGDIVLVMPGYTETISTATALAADVAGVVVVGLGAGSLRPTLTLDTATTTTIAVSAANFSFKNIVFSANFADIADLFTPTAVDFHCEDCDFVATAADVNFVEIADSGTTDNEIDGISFLRCKWIDPDLATTSMVNVDADIDGLSILQCYVNIGVNTSDLPVFADVAAGKDLTNVNIQRNDVIRLNDANPLLVVFADTTTTNTGIVANNKIRHLDTAGSLLVTAGTNIGMFDNLSTPAIDESGVVSPATADSSDNFIGADNANNEAATSSVVSNRDGTVLERLEDLANSGLRVAATSAAAVMVDNDDIFTIANGPIEILSLVSICVTGNDGTASTLQYEVDPTAGAAVTISGASASLASAVAGATVALQGTTLATAALLNASGGNVGAATGIIANRGVISLRLGVGSTTGTWEHRMIFRQFGGDVVVT